MNNLLAFMEGTEGGNNLWLLIIMGVFLLLILFTSFIPQKKRQKELMNMLASLKPGIEIKTIGGMVGKIESIDEEKGLLVINVGTEESPTLITIDKVAIYTAAIEPQVEAVATENVEEEVVEPLNEDGTENK